MQGKKCKVYPAPFAVHPFETKKDRPKDVDTVVEPDISVICDPEKLDDIGCKGAPDMIAEVLSPTTFRHDRVEKMEIYQKAGVKEYWLVSPESKSVEVFLLKDGKFQPAEAVQLTDKKKEAEDEPIILKVSCLDDCTINFRQHITTLKQYLLSELKQKEEVLEKSSCKKETPPG